LINWMWAWTLPGASRTAAAAASFASFTCFTFSSAAERAISGAGQSGLARPALLAAASASWGFPSAKWHEDTNTSASALSGSAAITATSSRSASSQRS